MILAAKAGDRAEGFVLALELAPALNDVTVEKPCVMFDSETEDRRLVIARSRDDPTFSGPG